MSPVKKTKTGRPRAQDRRDLRREFMDGAVALIRESGLIGFTLRELARRMRVSHNAYTRHFRDKEELLAAIAQEGQIFLDRDMREKANLNAPLLERLRQSGLAYVYFALSDPVRYSVMFDYPYPYGTHPGLDAAALGTFNTFVGVIQSGQGKGYFPGDARLHASICWAALHGISKLLTTGRLHYDSVEQQMSFADAAVTNLLGDWPRPSGKKSHERSAAR